MSSSTKSPSNNSQDLVVLEFEISSYEIFKSYFFTKPKKIFKRKDNSKLTKNGIFFK